MKSNNNNNFVLFIVLSAAIWFGFQYFYVRPIQEHYRQQQAALVKQAPDAKPASAKPVTPMVLRERAAVIKDSPRIPIETPELGGSINLQGANIDDLALIRYRETVDDHAPPVVLLSPAGSAPPTNAYYTQFSWLATDDSVPVPTAQTTWTTTDKKLTPDHPVHFKWDNGKGLIFERTIAVDQHFMFTVSDNVTNKGSAAVTLYPFGLVSRQGDYFLETRVLEAPVRSKYNPSSYEGSLGVLDGTLEEYTYKKLREEVKKTTDSVGGWLGFTDKYWLIALVPPRDEKISANFTYSGGAQPDPDSDHFQSDFRGNAMTVAPGANIEHATHVFAGAKHLEQLNSYSDSLNIMLFNRAIDFGWFWFLTIPFMELLNYLIHTLGNAGMAILILTIMIRLITVPLSIKMYHSSARMKEIMPEIKRIQERYKDDKIAQHKEQSALFKREKINPLSGCMPMLIQLPIFFALYKALNVSIELRQAPFYGWIRDMSVADPTSIFTLFGMIPWTPPIHIGAWPVLMGISMFIQQKLSPPPTDQSQARMFMFMPVVLTYIMAQLPVGLVIYYTWSNLLSILQQVVIMRRLTKKKRA